MCVDLLLKTRYVISIEFAGFDASVANIESEARLPCEQTDRVIVRSSTDDFEEIGRVIVDFVQFEIETIFGKALLFCLAESKHRFKVTEVPKHQSTFSPG